MKEIDDNSYNKEVIERNSKDSLPFILFFYSINCKFCYKVENILELLEKNKNYKNRINVYKVLSNNNNELVNLYNIKASPMLFIFDKNKKVKNQYMGSNIDYSYFYSNIDEIIDDSSILTIVKEFFKK